MNDVRKIAELVEAFLRYRQVVLRLYKYTPIEKDNRILSTLLTSGKLIRRQHDTDKWTVDELELLGFVFDINPKSCLYIKRLCSMLSLLQHEKQTAYLRLIGMSQKKFKVRYADYNNWSVHELELIAKHFNNVGKMVNR